MVVEKAEHFNLLIVTLAFLLILSYIANQFVNNVMISASIGLLATSLLMIFLLFSQVLGIAILAFVVVLVVVAVIVGNWAIGLFISSLVLGIFVFLNVFTS